MVHKTRPQGRPEWEPTKAQRRKIAIAAGGGMSHAAIAQAMGISKVTLEKHCHEELTTGAHQKRVEALQALHAAARRGSVAAVKAYLLLAPDPMFPTDPAPEKPEPMGKKERQQAEAVGAAVGTDWAALLDKQPMQ